MNATVTRSKQKIMRVLKGLTVYHAHAVWNALHELRDGDAHHSVLLWVLVV